GAGWGAGTFLSRSARACQGAITAPGSAYSCFACRSAGTSTAPVIVYFLPDVVTVIAEPTWRPADFRNGSVATSSSVPRGNAPSTRSIRFRAIRSEVLNSTISVLAMPYEVETVADTDCSLIARAPRGKTGRMSIGGTS